MMKLFLLTFLFILYVNVTYAVFLEENPNLKQFVFNEPKSSAFFGFGISPISMINSKLYMGGNLFQVHWIKDKWDIEIFSASYGTTINSEDFASSKHFTFRSIPKFKIFSVVSIGPLLGYEFVRFSKISSRLYKNRYVTPYDVFTGNGVIYGIGISETFEYKKTKMIKISQNIYKQTYSTTVNDDNWKYLFKNGELSSQANMDKITAGTVFMLEISLLL